MPAPPSEVESLIARGEYHAAARALADDGELERAQALLERVWDFAAAAGLARARGDRVATLRLLLESRQLSAADELLAELAGEQRPAGGEELRAAAEVCDRRRMWREAAVLLERAGEPAEARQRYARAGLLLEAGRLDEQAGDLRAAGLAYERLLSTGGEVAADGGASDRAQARRCLGRVLGLLGRHLEAVRQLQRALGSGQLEAAARDAATLDLVVSLAALGMTEGAGTVLARARAGAPGLPPLPAFLEERARARGGGDRLGGRYQVTRLLGAGAMGRVYLARDQVTDEEVAVKVVPPPIEPRARDSYRRFLREARAVAAIAHPNVVAAREVREAEGLLVMEYLPGGTLEARPEGPEGLARPGAGPIAATRKLLLEVVAGLTAAHARGIVHRDVKPANVFFTATGEAKLGDFGAAHLADLGATRTAGFVGTLAYMAPEQITAAPLTFACDVYALGVTAFQVLTGRLPFEGPDFVGQHLGEPPPAPSSRAAGGAAWAGWVAWDRLVLRMLAKSPAARHGSLEELRREIEALPVLEAARAAVASSPGRPAVGAAPAGGGEPAESAALERYRVEADLAVTPLSTLHLGIDQRLGRPVMLERFAAAALAGEAGGLRLARLRALARHGGPHLQRVLRLDLAAGLAVYEAPQGTPLQAAARPLSPAAAARLCLEVLAALAGPHHEGRGHGALDAAVTVSPGGATVLIAGSSARVSGEPTPAADHATLRALLGWLSPGLDLPAAARGPAALTGWARAAARGR